MVMPLNKQKVEIKNGAGDLLAQLAGIVPRTAGAGSEIGPEKIFTPAIDPRLQRQHPVFSGSDVSLFQSVQCLNLDQGHVLLFVPRLPADRIWRCLVRMQMT